MQVTGLASGLDTNAIVTALMAADQQQVTNLTNQQTGLTAMNTQLTDIQTALQTVANDAQALGNPSLFAPRRRSARPTPRWSAPPPPAAPAPSSAPTRSRFRHWRAPRSTPTRSRSPTSADTVTFDNGQQISLAAGATADDLVNAINSNSKLNVWATVTQEAANGKPATIILSDRQTGLPAGTTRRSRTPPAD